MGCEYGDTQAGGPVGHPLEGRLWEEAGGIQHMEQFQTGDVVRLKSGGPCMTITAIGDYSGWTMSPSHTVSCMWFEGQKKQETVFDVAILEKVSS